MKFCNYCENMMYTKIVNEDKNEGETLIPKNSLIYYCKHCGFEFVADRKSQLLIDDNQVDDSIKIKPYINKYIKFDPTLPRVNNIQCTNEKCKREDGTEEEVIYLKYDFTNMKYLYFCCHCDQFFKNDTKNI